MISVRWMAAAVAIGMIGSMPVRAARIAVKDGQKIAFMGDLITEAAADPGGNVMMATGVLKAFGLSAKQISKANLDQQPAAGK